MEFMFGKPANDNIRKQFWW